MNEPSNEERITQLEAAIAVLTNRQVSLEQTKQTDLQELDFAARLEKLKYYREENAREWALLSNRVSSYITSQSFLITSYAISMGNQTHEATWFRLLFSLILVYVGVETSNRAKPGITGAKEILEIWRKKHEALFDEANVPADHPIRAFKDNRTLIDVPVTTKTVERIGNKHESQTVKEEVATTKKMDMIHERSLYFAEKAPGIFKLAWYLLGVLSVIVFALALANHSGVKIP